MSAAADKTIAFQGYPGAYSHLACRARFPDMTPHPCESFEDAFAMVERGDAKLAMIPIENSQAGRVADIHHLLPDSSLHIIGEHYQPVDHCLIGTKDATLDQVTRVHSHIQALTQCRQLVRVLNLDTNASADTAGSAKEIGEWGDPTQAAIASSLAAETYDLKILKEGIADQAGNTTRFIILSRDEVIPPRENGPSVMTIIFGTRSVPASLYKALGGFATNGVNITKLESYLVGERFNAARFHIDIIGHPEDAGIRHAMEELRFFSHDLRVFGTYPADPFRGL